LLGASQVECLSAISSCTGTDELPLEGKARLFLGSSDRNEKARRSYRT